MVALKRTSIWLQQSSSAWKLWTTTKMLSSMCFSAVTTPNQVVKQIKMHKKTCSFRRTSTTTTTETMLYSHKFRHTQALTCVTTSKRITSALIKVALISTTQLRGAYRRLDVLMLKTFSTSVVQTLSKHLMSGTTVYNSRKSTHTSVTISIKSLTSLQTLFDN